MTSLAAFTRADAKSRNGDAVQRDATRCVATRRDACHGFSRARNSRPYGQMLINRGASTAENFYRLILFSRSESQHVRGHSRDAHLPPTSLINIAGLNRNSTMQACTDGTRSQVSSRERSRGDRTKISDLRIHKMSLTHKLSSGVNFEELKYTSNRDNFIRFYSSANGQLE